MPHIRLPHHGTGVQTTALEIGGNHATGRGIGFHKDNGLGFSAQGFDAHRPTAGKEVGPPYPNDPVT
jgi:hypothetical protein